MCRGMAVISITYGSPARMAITNVGYGNAKAFPDVIGLGYPTTSQESCGPWPFYTTSFPPPPFSSPCRYQCCLNRRLGHRQPVIRYWLEWTALLHIFAKSVTCGFRLPPADHFSPKGVTGLHSDTVRYDREYVMSHIGEIGVLWVRFFLLPPPVSDTR